MMTVNDVKKYFGCGINRAYDIVNQRDFPKIKIGRRIYIPEEDFTKWCKSYLRKEYKIHSCVNTCVKEKHKSYKYSKINGCDEFE